MSEALIALIAGALTYSIPLALASLGEVVNQRAGQVNVGLEGMMLGGAFFGMTATLGTGSPALGLLVGVAVGVLLGLLQAVFTIKLSRDQVVIGVALNLFVLGLTNTLFRSRFGESGQLLSVPTLPKWHGFDVMLPIALLVAAGLSVAIHHSAWGLAVRSAGEMPRALQSVGHSVPKLRLQAACIGAALAGLAGAYLAVGLTGTFNEGMPAGKGFMALAMVSFGRWRTPWVYLACVFIATAEASRFTLQATGVTWIPSQALVAFPYVLALVVVVVVGRGNDAPQHLGRPYEST